MKNIILFIFIVQTFFAQTSFAEGSFLDELGAAIKSQQVYCDKLKKIASSSKATVTSEEKSDMAFLAKKADSFLTKQFGPYDLQLIRIYSTLPGMFRVRGDYETIFKAIYEFARNSVSQKDLDKLANLITATSYNNGKDYNSGIYDKVALNDAIDYAVFFTVGVFASEQSLKNAKELNPGVNNFQYYFLHKLHLINSLAQHSQNMIKITLDSWDRVSCEYK